MKIKKKIDSIGTTENEKDVNIDLDVEYENKIGNLYGDNEFSGPIQNRKCTNVYFLMIFLMLNLCLIGTATYTFISGNPNYLTKGNDLRGHICGFDYLSQKRFMFFPNSTNTDWSLCVEACPYYYYENYYCIYEKNNPDIYYTEWGCFNAYETTAYGFYCIPAENGREIIINYLEQLMQTIKIATGDLFLVWDVILIGYVFSICIGLLYLYLIRIKTLARYLITGSVYCLFILAGGLVYLLYAIGKRSNSQTCNNYGPAKPNYCDISTYIFYLSLSVICSIFLILYMLRISKKYSCFNVGIIIIELTSKPLRVMKELALFPIIQIIIGSGIFLLLACLIGWNISTYSSVSINNKDIPGGQAYVLEYTALEKYMLVFNAIMSLWWCNFLVDLGKYVISGGVSTWYFSRQKSVLYVIII